MPDFSTTLRRAIQASGKSQLELAAASKVPQPRISAFLRGGSLRVEHFGRLCKAVGLRLMKV